MEKGDFAVGILRIKPTTNGDSIRMSSDEGLARIVLGVQKNSIEFALKNPELAKRFDFGEEIFAEVLDYLQQPYEEGECKKDSDLEAK